MSSHLFHCILCILLELILISYAIVDCMTLQMVNAVRLAILCVIRESQRKTAAMTLHQITFKVVKEYKINRGK